MSKSDERQTQDKRTAEPKEETAEEEYTTYREEAPGQARPGEAGARKEADLQPAPTREGDPDAPA